MGQILARMKHPRPPYAKLRKLPRCDVGGISVFTDRPITVAIQVAMKVEHRRRDDFARRWWGYCNHQGRRVYWMRYGFAIHYFGR